MPMMDQPIRSDRDSLTLGYAGGKNPFLLFAKRAGEKNGVSARDLLVQVCPWHRRGAKKMIEDLVSHHVGKQILSVSRVL